jgi:hypothetical protein
MAATKGSSGMTLRQMAGGVLPPPPNMLQVSLLLWNLSHLAATQQEGCGRGLGIFTIALSRFRGPAVDCKLQTRGWGCN